MRKIRNKKVLSIIAVLEMVITIVLIGVPNLFFV